MPAPSRSLPPPTKKRKIKQNSGFVDAVQQLESQLIGAVTQNSSLNALANLLQLALKSEDAQDTSKAIYALYRVFTLIIAGGKLAIGGDEAARVVKAWIWERANVYVDFLCSLLKDDEKILRISALQILFSLLKHLSTSSTNAASTSTFTLQPQFHISHFRKIVTALLVCPPSQRSGSKAEHDSEIDADVKDTFVETWFSVHDDVRWFFLREAAPILSAHLPPKHANTPTNLLSILECLNTFPTEQAELNSFWVAEFGTKPPKPKRSAKKGKSAEEESGSSAEEEGDEGDEDDWRKFFEEDSTAKDSTKPKTPLPRLHKLTIHQSLHSLASHRAVFTRAWLTLLPELAGSNVTFTKALAIRALNVMHRGVMPHLTRPVLVMDWVGACVDYGGPVGLLALNALFILMKEYNLDYPSFYTRLYAFLDRDVLHSKHRARFFRMTELFLSSTHLPATLLASFVKRLSRLSLAAPPAAIIMIVPFTYNILKRHPALMVMIHRDAEDGDTDIDPFLPLESNPNTTNALGSSLWELYSHKKHYHAAVSTLVRIFEEAFTKPGYSMEDFLDHTYGTLLETEVSRRIKKEPALAVNIGKEVNLFPSPNSEATSGSETNPTNDIINEFWAFG